MEQSKLPKFKFILDEESEDSGVNVLSLVEEPAIELSGMTFSDKKKLQFKVTDKEKMIFMAPVMRPDFLIFRDEPFYYWGYFDQETIFSIYQKYMKTGKIGNIDVNHSGNLIDGAYVLETFIIDTEIGIHTPSSYPDVLPNGTWFCIFQVTDPKLWKQIQAGEITGVSIEGFFNVQPVQMNKPKSLIQKTFDEISAVLKDLDI